MIEMLVVIVVFLVGILAVIQVFPPGLRVLRVNSGNTVATQLGSAEMQRIQGQPGQTAEMIVPVLYASTASGVRVQVDTNRLTSDLMPAVDPSDGKGKVDSTGQVVVNGKQIGEWPRVSGSNVFSRVIGESRPVPGPTQVPGLPAGLDFGGVMQMTFGPAYYFPQNGIGEPGVVLAYGNDYARRDGNRDFNNPNPFGRWRDGEFFFVNSEQTDDQNWPGEDQIWVAPGLARKYRLQFSFAYDGGKGAAQYDLIVPLDLDPNDSSKWANYAIKLGNYWVVSLKRVIAEKDLYTGEQQFDPNNYLFAEGNSIRLQRVYQEIPANVAFDVNDPYQYKVIGSGYDAASGQGFCMGTLMFNPAGFNYTVNGANGREGLLARLDYTVFDWRLIKDEFKVPQNETAGGQVLPQQVKLSLSSLKVLNALQVDDRKFSGLGLSTPTLAGLGKNQTDDVVVEDLDTGGVILGNQPNDPSSPGYPQNPDSAWWVDKTTGQIVFRDVDGDGANGMSAYLCFPTGDQNNPWTARQLVPDIANRNVRVIYMGRAEWSVQPFKAARQYRTTRFLSAKGLGPGECFVGGTPDSGGSPVGQPYRVYFGPYDRGQKVVVGELWVTTGGQPTVLYDQEFQIAGLENVNGLTLAYLDIRDKAPNAVFDWSQGYSVRRVKGVSLNVRVLWNPTSFKLTPDPLANFDELEYWMRGWRKSETEGLQIGGRN